MLGLETGNVRVDFARGVVGVTMERPHPSEQKQIGWRSEGIPGLPIARCGRSEVLGEVVIVAKWRVSLRGLSASKTSAQRNREIA